VHADLALEALLPDKVSGVQLTKESLGPDLFVGPQNEAKFARLLAAVGRSREDVTLARASDLTNAVLGRVDALKVTGADSNVLLSALLAEPPYDSANISQTSIDGKDVTVVTFDNLGTEYYYVPNDVAFIVTGAAADTAALFLQALP
jgi:hypothetical protein